MVFFEMVQLRVSHDIPLCMTMMQAHNVAETRWPDGWEADALETAVKTFSNALDDNPTSQTISVSDTVVSNATEALDSLADRVDDDSWPATTFSAAKDHLQTAQTYAEYLSH